jgi:hypothetical protein
MIFHAMALQEPMLHAANLYPRDEMNALKVIALFEFHLRELAAALDRGVLTRSEFVTKRDQLTRTTRTKLRATLSKPSSVRLEDFIHFQIGRIHANPISPQEA